jgi:two-component system, cell cycle response regulator
LRILAANADPVVRLALESLLQQWGHEVVTTDDGHGAWQILSDKNAPSLGLLQWELPGIDAPLLTRKLRDRADAPYIYLILTGQAQGDQDAIVALEAGADDLISNPLDQPTLQIRLRTAEHILALQRNLLQSRQALEYKSTHDALTGVWNRGEVLGLLEREIARAQREGCSVCIIMIDVDHFKDVNDTHGHLAGDAALREVSTRLASCVRPYDAIGRYGGEEFLVVLSGCSAANAVRLADRLREEVCISPIILNEAQLEVTISLGVAIWSPAECGDVQALIRGADAALYRAKREGRNRVQKAWEEPPTAAADGDWAAA